MNEHNNMNSQNDDLNEEEVKKDKLQYKQFVLIILLTVIMVLISLGFSFSIITLFQDSKNMNYNSLIVPVIPNVNTGEITFSYMEKEIVGNGVVLQNAFPMSDKDGMNLAGENNTFAFSLYFGNDSYKHYYEITAERRDYSTLSSEYVKLYLESDNEPLETAFNDDKKIKIYPEYENATINKESDKEKILYSAKISKRDIAMGHKNFVLKMWVASGMPLNSDTMDKVFAVRINVYAK